VLLWGGRGKKTLFCKNRRNKFEGHEVKTRQETGRQCRKKLFGGVCNNGDNRSRKKLEGAIAGKKMYGRGRKGGIAAIRVGKAPCLRMRSRRGVTKVGGVGEGKSLTVGAAYLCRRGKKKTKNELAGKKVMFSRERNLKKEPRLRLKKGNRTLWQWEGEQKRVNSAAGEKKSKLLKAQKAQRG